MSVKCEYCNIMFSNKTQIKAHQQRSKKCKKELKSCPIESKKTYDVANPDCIDYARNIFEVIVNELGTAEFYQLEKKVDNYYAAGYITLENQVEILIKLDELVEKYYEFVDNVVLKNKGESFASSGEKFKIETPAQWATVIRTLMRRKDDAIKIINDNLESKKQDIKGKQTYCDNASNETCKFPCKVQSSGFFGLSKKCTYAPPKA